VAFAFARATAAALTSLAGLALALGVSALALALPARADEGWHSEQPPPPPGTSIGVPVPLGAVGDIEFWAPNRGLLTTAGNDGVPAGLWAYDGSGWNEISTVCGGHEGRIAWAGPDEWWTIADQPPGQIVTGLASQTWHRSLCHFLDGRVVASYAEPIGTPTSYLPLDAAACSGPDDCWFAGERLPGTTNVGAFHLHWDGQTLTAVPSLTTPQPELNDPPRSVASLAYYRGTLYESVQVQKDDVAPNESAEQPFLLHEITPGSSSPFQPLFTSQPIDYGGVPPWRLAALRLTSDGSQLWAIAGTAPGGGTAPKVVALRLGEAGFAPVALNDPQGVLGSAVIDGAAAEPGTDAAWVSYANSSDSGGASDPAQLVRIHADGTVEAPVTLPGAGETIARKGAAGPVACPATGQCWMATREGWLFHLGGSLAQDPDPVLHGLITYRPPDDSIPFVPPDALPVDDSGANLPPEAPPPYEEQAAPRTPSPARPLAFDVRRRMVHGTTLVLSFRLRARARVQLIARRGRRVVARTAPVTLKAGAHTLSLRLDPRHWPTKLDLQTSRIAAGLGR
jgi:hypothetical protein